MIKKVQIRANIIVGLYGSRNFFYIFKALFVPIMPTFQASVAKVAYVHSIISGAKNSTVVLFKEVTLIDLVAKLGSL